MIEKNIMIHTRVSPHEYALIKCKMDELGIKNMSAYLRKMAIDGYAVKLDLSDVKELVRLLRYCSNNLNQYAKKANETGNIYLEDIRELQKSQNEILMKLKEVIQKLNRL